MFKFTVTTYILFISMLSSAFAATVRVTGMSDELIGRMSVLIEPRLEYINQRPATEWRADDSAFFLRQLLVKEGYSDSKVDWELPGNDNILLRVTLGTRYVIGNISSVSGDSLNQDLINKYFAEQITTGKLINRANAPFLEEYPAKGAESIANYLKSIGYWDANVTVASVVKNPDGQVDIKINIQRGSIFKILTPTFNGVTSEQLTSIREAISEYVGQDATSENISDLNNAVYDYFSDAGFEFAKVNIKSNQTTGISLVFDIDPGNIYTVRGITVTGDERTKRSRFNRYTSSIVGEIYNKSEVDQITKKLILTGAFESVRILPERLDDNTLILNIEVDEAKPKFIRGYTGVASFDGFVLGASYTDQNFFNKLQTFVVRSEISSRGLLGEVSLTEPFFAGIPLAQTTRLYALQKSFDGYDTAKTGLEFSFEYEIGDHLTSRLYATAELVNLDPDGLTPAEIGPDNYLNAKVGFEQTLDLRNDRVLPTSGFHARGLLEYGTINGDAANSYFRTNLNTSYRFILNEESNQRIALRFGAGAILPSDSNDLPVDLRVFSGGAESIRSFRERELGPLSEESGDPLGGQSYWNFTAEYIHPFNDLVSAVVFYDTGQLFARAGDFSFSDPTHGIGLGIHLDLPIGPVRLEYGYNLNPGPREASGAFHFSIGAQF